MESISQANPFQIAKAEIQYIWLNNPLILLNVIEKRKEKENNKGGGKK